MSPPETLDRRDVPEMADLAARLFVDHPLAQRFLGDDAEQTLRSLYVAMLGLTLADPHSRSIALGHRLDGSLRSAAIAQLSSWQPAIFPFLGRMLSLAATNSPGRTLRIARFLGAFDEMRLLHPGSDNELEISLLACDRPFQRRGLGSDLMRTIVRHAKTDGYRQLRLEVAAENPAIRLYEKSGFTITDSVRIAGAELHIMRLPTEGEWC